MPYRRGQAAGPRDVVAEGKHDRDELVAFVRASTGYPQADIESVLDLWDEYLAAVGIAEVGGDDLLFEHYDQAHFTDQRNSADPDRVAGLPASKGIA